MFIVGTITGKELRLQTDDAFQVANGGLPPEWGYDLKFSNTMINYGPWADKQKYVWQMIEFLIHKSHPQGT
jgi:hypothetical protein